MALMDIRVYGDPVLETRTEPVEKVDESIRKLVADMYETMKAAPGIGLAAPQVGVSKRLCLVDLSAGAEPDHLMVLINPEIISEEGYQKEEEGCLSFPGIFGHVERPLKAKVRYTDMEGNEKEIEGDDLLARALCHEIDHLDGVVFVNRMSPLKRRLVLKTIRKLQRDGQWEHRPGEGSEERA